MLNKAKESFHHVQNASAELAHRTRDEYLHMSPEDRTNCRRAFYCTVGGVALTALNTFYLERKLQDHPSKAIRYVPTVIRAAAYSCDFVDGKMAKGDAATELGGIVDPLADKTINLMNEATSELPKWHVAARVGRDALVTAARSYVTSRSNGKVNVKATKAGKYNTALRDTANVLNGSPLADEFPITNKIIQTVSTTNSVMSGMQNIVGITRNYQKWRAEQATD